MTCNIFYSLVSCLAVVGVKPTVTGQIVVNLRVGSLMRTRSEFPVLETLKPLNVGFVKHNYVISRNRIIKVY